MAASAVRNASLAGIGAYAVLLVTAILILVPIFWIFSTSFKPNAEILVTPTTILPADPTLAHYEVALSGDFRRYLVNSLIAAGGEDL